MPTLKEQDKALMGFLSRVNEYLSKQKKFDDEQQRKAVIALVEGWNALSLDGVYDDQVHHQLASRGLFVKTPDPPKQIPKQIQTAQKIVQADQNQEFTDLSQPDANTCQSTCIAMALGSDKSQIMTVRKSLLAIGKGRPAGDPNVMAEYLQPKLGNRYELHLDASMSEIESWLNQGAFLITHGFFTHGGHVIGLDGYAIQSGQRKVSVKDPWDEFDFGQWRYPGKTTFYDGFYSELGLYSAIMGWSLNESIQYYKSGHVDRNKKAAYVHVIWPKKKQPEVISLTQSTVSSSSQTSPLQPDSSNYLVTAEQAFEVYGSKLYDKELKDLNDCLKVFNITTPQRIRHFLSQTAHESGGLRWLEEIDPGHYLEGRTDLGNTQPGDGPKFKGAGVIQLTGRSNYQKLADVTDDPKVMTEGCSYVAKTYPFTSAGVWWNANNMNELCDKPNVTVLDVTLRVNGGTNGLDDRIHYYEKARKVIV